MKDNTLKKINYSLYVIYAITLIYALVTTYGKDSNAFAMGLVAIFVPLITPIIFKLFKWKTVQEIYTVNIVFIYFASLIGSSLGGYSIAGFDKVLHFSSGFIATLVGVIVYYFIKKQKRVNNKEDFIISLIFINLFNISVAAIWEFYEYAILVLFDNDAINHYSTGVHDSMTDMILATLAGLIVAFIYYKYYKTGKSNFFINIYEKFYEYNIKSK